MPLSSLRPLKVRKFETCTKTSGRSKLVRRNTNHVRIDTSVCWMCLQGHCSSAASCRELESAWTHPATPELHGTTNLVERYWKEIAHQPREDSSPQRGESALIYTQHSPHYSTHTHRSMVAHLRLALRVHLEQFGIRNTNYLLGK